MAQRAWGMCVFIREPGKNLVTRIQVEFRPSAYGFQYLTVAPLLCARVLLKYLPFFLADQSCQKQSHLVQHPLEYVALGAVGLLPTFVCNRSCNKTSKEVLCWGVPEDCWERVLSLCMLICFVQAMSLTAVWWLSHCRLSPLSRIYSNGQERLKWVVTGHLVILMPPALFIYLLFPVERHCQGASPWMGVIHWWGPALLNLQSHHQSLEIHLPIPGHSARDQRRSHLSEFDDINLTNKETQLSYMRFTDTNDFQIIYFCFVNCKSVCAPDSPVFWRVQPGRKGRDWSMCRTAVILVLLSGAATPMYKLPLSQLSSSCYSLPTLLLHAPIPAQERGRQLSCC